MAHEFARNLQDASFVITRALTAADGSVTSSDIDLGADTYKPEVFELNVNVPSLSASELASADTLTVEVLNGAAASPTTVIASRVLTGTGSASSEQNYRFRLPSNAGRFLAVKFTTAGTTGDMSAKSATISLRF